MVYVGIYRSYILCIFLGIYRSQYIEFQLETLPSHQEATCPECGAAVGGSKTDKSLGFRV